MQPDNIKHTSYQYGESHQQQMLKYYRKQSVESEENYEYLRIQLIKQLIELAHSKLPPKDKKDTVLVDIGCSIGGCAIPLSKMGFTVHGVDFDPAAVRIAEQLNEVEVTSAQFHQMDVSNWTENFPLIDIALSADLFEHLHDDELGGLLSGLKKNMSPDGILVFYTVPQQYDYIFWRKTGDKGRLEIPWFLLPFIWLNDKYFTRIVRVAALCFDILCVLRKGLTYKERIKRSDHPNPLTKERLTDILERMGYEILFIESSTMGISEQMNLKHREFFRTHSITHCALYGLARLKDNT